MPTRTVFPLLFLSISTKQAAKLLIRRLSYYSISIFSKMAPSEGIEPPVQEPESYVLSITPRGQKKQKKSTHPRLTKSMM